MSADAATRPSDDAAARHEAAAEELAERLMELASIKSVSRQEKPLCDWLEARLRAPGRDVLRVGDNLVVTIPELRATTEPGAESGVTRARPRVLFCGHLDTVPENQNFPPRREGDTIHGLGTTDLKSGLAVIWHLLDEISARMNARAAGRAALLEQLAVEPVFVFYAREEIAYAESGLAEVERAWPELRGVDFAICVEPTSNAVELGCNGTLHAEVTVRGKAAHAARPWLGRNAIHAALPILQRIASRPERRWSPPGRPDIEYREVISATGIQGGKARNVVPDACSFNVNFRFAPDRTPDAARAVVSELVAGEAEIAWKDVAPSGRVPTGNPTCERLIALAGAVRAKQAWTDVGRFTSWSVDAVSCGPGTPELAHQQAEHASIARMLESRRLFRSLLRLDGAIPKPPA